MATFQKRGSGWRAGVARAGRRIGRTFDTRADAERWAIETEAALLVGQSVVETPAAGPGKTVADLFQKYATTVSPGKGGARWEVVRLKSLPATFPLFAGPVAALDGPALADWRDARLRRVASSTVNRELNLISAVINMAIKEWRVPGLIANPVHAIKRPVNPRARTRRVSAADRAEITKKLEWCGQVQPVGAEQWIAWSFALALETAMRKGEILALTWQHVHTDEQRLHLPDTKNGYARDVPLSSRALALLALLTPGEPGASVVPVQSGTFGTLFGRAKLAAGRADLHFHDSRREATTVMAAKLDSVLELAAITGHRSLDVLRKVYYQPNASTLAAKLG